jgi:hypothetical protein
MKKIKLMGRLAVVTLLVTLSSNAVLANTKPNLNVAANASNYKKAASEIAAISPTQLKTELEKIDLAALAEKPEVKALLSRMAKDKALSTTMNAVMKNNLGGKDKAALLVSAVRPYTGDWWECVGTCLRSAGVSAYSLLVCAGVCLVTMGLGCAICLGVTIVLTEACAYLCAKEVVQMEESIY